MKIFLWKEAEYEFIICSAENVDEARQKVTKEYGETDIYPKRVGGCISIGQFVLEEPIVLEGDFCKVYDHSNE